MSCILVVDDEAPNRRLLEVLLLGDGYTVREARDGVEAVEAIAAGGIDLVLVDVMMPRKDGIAFCRELRGPLAMPDLPVVMVTALTDRASRIAGKEAGADDFLTKPVDSVELLTRVRVLLRLRELQLDQRRQHRLLQAVVRSMADGVVVSDPAGAILLTNPAAARHLSAPSAAQLLSDSGSPVVSGPTALEQALRASSATPARLFMRGTAAAEGTHLSVQGRPLVDDQGLRMGEVAVLHDVSREVELDQFKDEMAALVAHDLNGLMAVISGNLEYGLERLEAAPSEVVEALGDARRASRRALRLIANLRDTARLETGSIAMKPAVLDLVTLVEHLHAQHRFHLRHRGITLVSEVPADLALDCDPDLLSRVLENILDNAVRFTPRGGRITIAARVDAAGSVQIRLGNTGPGLTPAQRTRVFEKYAQVDPSVDGRHHGLGLYFCSLAVTAHGGRIWVEDDEQQPTVFVIELPPTPPGGGNGARA